MDELDHLKAMRADLPRPSMAATDRAETTLARVIANERDRAEPRDGETSRSRITQRRWALAGSGGLLAAALVAIVAFGLSDGGAKGEPKVLYGDSLEQFPSETASDVVSWADQVSIVTAVAAVEVPEEDAPPAQRAAGEGLIDRNITFRVDRTIWHREGAPTLKGTIVAREFGWTLREFKRTRFTALGTPWIEVGSQYLMPLAYDRDEWAPILPSAVFPYEDGQVKPAENQDAPLATQLSGDSLEQSAEAFDSARPDPAVVKHFDLQPTAREHALVTDREGEASK